MGKKKSKAEKSYANQFAELEKLADELTCETYHSLGSNPITFLPKMSGTVVVNRGVLIPLVDAVRLLEMLKGKEN